jgi:hypothetical protein
MKVSLLGAISWKKVTQHVLAVAAGIAGALYLPLENKDLVGWLVGAFTAFGGLLLAVMTLAGHSLTLLQGEDWQALQFFKNTYKARIFFSALLSFLLIFTVPLILGNFLLKIAYLQYVAGFFSGACFLYVLIIPFHLFNMYSEYYDFLIKQSQNRKNEK